MSAFGSFPAMKKQRLSVVILVLAGLALGTIGCEALQSYNINGTWSFSLRTEDHYQFTVAFSGTKTGGSGTFTYDGNAYSGIYVVENGRAVTFKFSGSDTALCGTMDGTFSSSDEMSGSWINSVDSSTGTWEATRN